MPGFKSPVNFVLRVQEYLSVLGEIGYKTLSLSSPSFWTKPHLFLLSCSLALPSTSISKEQVQEPRLQAKVGLIYE